MEGEQFSLCWNNFHSNLSTGFHNLFKDEDLVDVTLAAEGKYLKAHKTVLSVCSPYFKELFRVNPCKHPIVILQDVNYGALCNLLQFMYQGEVSVSQEEIPTFMRVAETLKVKGLTDNATASDSNGYEHSNRGSYNFQEHRNIMKRPRIPMKKPIRPMPHPIRQIETPSPKPARSPQPQPQPQQPPAKKPHIEEQPKSSNSTQLTTNQQAQSSRSATPHQQSESPEYAEPLIKPKEEPVDPPSDENTAQSFEDNEHFDPTTLMEATMDKKPPGAPPNWNPELNKMDSSSPGAGLVLVKSGKGQLVSIYNGHIYTISEMTDARTVWVCVKKKMFSCSGCIVTKNGPNVVSYSSHNHPQLHDVIKRLQVPRNSFSPDLF